MQRQILSLLGAKSWLLLFALCFAIVGPAHADKRVALVIGNSGYKSVAPLANPQNDARLMADTLRSLGFTLVGGRAQIDLDKAAFDEAVQSFGTQVVGADVALFYYAGHGVQVRGSNYLVPIAANPAREADVYLQMVDIAVVLSQMEGSGTKLNLVILDACRNNPFGGRGLRATDPGLAQIRAPEGTVISYATQPGNVAKDGADGNSPYTKALAQTIKRPGLSMFDAFNEVGIAVMEATGNEQQPWLSTSPIKGSFSFAAAPTGSAGPVSPPPASEAAQAWSVIQNTTSIAVLEDFTRQFGNTVYGSMARARLAELKSGQVAVVAPPAPPQPGAPSAKPALSAIPKLIRGVAAGGSGGDPFDDSGANFRNEPLSGINIVLNQNPADAKQQIIGTLQVLWLGTEGPLHGGRGPLATARMPIQFSPGETVTKVAINSVTYNFPATPRPVWIAGLRIWTNKTTYTFGTMSPGSVTECALSPGETLIGFYGRSGSYIDQLGCVIAATK
jgi:hypothetical protein